MRFTGVVSKPGKLLSKIGKKFPEAGLEEIFRNYGHLGHFFDKRFNTKRAVNRVFCLEKVFYRSRYQEVTFFFGT